jgi:transcription termination factor Rho
MPVKKTDSSDKARADLPLEEKTSEFTITVEDIIGNPVPVSIPEPIPQPQKPAEEPLVKPVPTTNNPNFTGYIDNRVIPDAGLPTETVEGVLDLTSVGHGYLRPEFMPSNHDVYISSSQIRRFQLRPGDVVTGQARHPKENERYWGLLKVEKINGQSADKIIVRPDFDKLTPIYPKNNWFWKPNPKYFPLG